eukprot:3188122-Rhodomonas_salina.2
MQRLLHPLLLRLVQLPGADEGLGLRVEHSLPVSTRSPPAPRSAAATLALRRIQRARDSDRDRGQAGDLAAVDVVHPPVVVAAHACTPTPSLSTAFRTPPRNRRVLAQQRRHKRRQTKDRDLETPRHRHRIPTRNPRPLPALSSTESDSLEAIGGRKQLTLLAL